MDFFSHGLWAAAAAKAKNKYLPAYDKSKKLSPWLTAFWGVFPDAFAFTIPFFSLIVGFINGTYTVNDLPRPPQAEEPPGERPAFFTITPSLYNISHSAVIFLLAFFIVWLIFRRPVWEMSAWLLHILIDIPTHTYQFYATPVFWPLSTWKFGGFSWATPWFFILNYTAIITVYTFLLRRKQSSKTL